MNMTQMKSEQMKKLYLVFFLWLIPTYMIALEPLVKAWALSHNVQPGDQIVCTMLYDEPIFFGNCSMELHTGEIVTRLFMRFGEGEWEDSGEEPLNEEEYVFVEERRFDLTNDDF